jgi:hypothetical protein
MSTTTHLATGQEDSILSAFIKIADALRTFIDTNVIGQRLARQVVLISHSLGGLVCRQAVVDYLKPEVSKKADVIGLMMMGTPNLGTDIARVAARILPSRSSIDMKPWSDYLELLNRDWSRRVVNGGTPDLAPEERRSLKCVSVYGLLDRVVPSSSAAAGASLGDVRSINKGHIDLPKAASKDDGTYGVVKGFIVDCIALAPERPLTQASAVVAHRVLHRMREAWRESQEWTENEEDIITIRTREALPAFLECEVTSSRTGGLPHRDLTVGLALESYQPKNLRIDYCQLLGKGLLTNDEFRAIGDRLEQASASQTDFDKILRVTRASFAKVGAGSEMSYQAPTFQAERRYALLKYRLDALDPAIGRDNVLKLSVTSFLSKHHGWYGYVSTRTILGDLKLQLVAPFPVRMAGGSWWSSQKPDEDFINSKQFSSRVTIPGPIPIGTLVLWIFDVQ